MSEFLERWSRLKKAAREGSDVPFADGESLLANLTPDSDFGQFLREEISEEIRRKAMKALFADPHFNVMDGLDVYIEDFNISEPIPEAMMASLRHARGLLFDEPEAAEDSAAGGGNGKPLTGDGSNVAAQENSSAAMMVNDDRAQIHLPQLTPRVANP